MDDVASHIRQALPHPRVHTELCVAPGVRPRRYCSPRHRMPVNTKCASITWRARFGRPYPNDSLRLGQRIVHALDVLRVYLRGGPYTASSLFAGRSVRSCQVRVRHECQARVSGKSVRQEYQASMSGTSFAGPASGSSLWFRSSTPPSTSRSGTELCGSGGRGARVGVGGVGSVNF